MGECCGLRLSLLDIVYMEAERQVANFGQHFHWSPPSLSLQAVPFRNPRLDPMSPSGLMSPASGVMSPTTMPPSHMSMLIGSPPRGGGGRGTAPSLSDVLKRLSLSDNTRQQSGEAAAAVPSGPLQIDLGCLLPPEARGLSITTKKRQQQGAAAAASQPGSTGEGPTLGGNLSSISGQASSSTDAAIAGRIASPPPASTSARGMEGGSSAAAHDAATHYGRIRQELGQGEGVTALLERSKGKGGPIVATEDDTGGGGGQCFSDDEGPPGTSGGGGHHAGGGGPMSPSTRLRRDTFGATLDFIEALCDASSSLASFSQVWICVGGARDMPYFGTAGPGWAGPELTAYLAQP